MKLANQNSAILRVLLLAALVFSLTGCKSILPQRSVPAEDQFPLFKAPTFQPTTQSLTAPTAAVEGASTQTAECTNLLQYVSDITYPDFTEVKPGETIDKQWKVKNAGTCNWDAAYSIQMTSGESMSSISPQALVPARNGTETVISIQFVAPDEPGRYSSFWKAFAPNGQPFGDQLYVDITVIE
jgi:hypothetical protein